MSKVLIEQYYNNLDRAVQFGKTKNESSVKYHFWNLLNDYARKQNYEVVNLLKRVCTVSVETVNIMREMEGEEM